MALAKEYDGIWFLGFNVQKPPFDSLQARQAVASAFDKSYVTANIISAEAYPTSLIPPGLTGYDPALLPFTLNIKKAKTLMQQAKYPPNTPLLKRLTLLHTDGLKTVAIAKKIREDLKQLGIKLELVQVSYRDEDRWQRELAAHKHHLFLMGYKADIASLFTKEATARPPDSYLLLDPLFKTGGEANFTGYSNPAVDNTLDQLSIIGPAFSAEREEKLEEINRQLYRDLPVLVIFYIEKL